MEHFGVNDPDTMISVKLVPSLQQTQKLLRFYLIRFEDLKEKQSSHVGHFSKKKDKKKFTE